MRIGRMISAGRVDTDTFSFANNDSLAQSIKIRLRCAFDPYMKQVLALRNLVNYELQRRIHHRIKWRRERDHHTAHLGVNIAKDIGHSFARELNVSRATGLVEAQIEALAVKH